MTAESITTIHPQVRLAANGRRADVDILLAPVIRELWRLDMDTGASCQRLRDDPDFGADLGDYAYVGFLRMADAATFASWTGGIHVPGWANSYGTPVTGVLFPQAALGRIAASLRQR